MGLRTRIDLPLGIAAILLIAATVFAAQGGQSGFVLWLLALAGLAVCVAIWQAEAAVIGPINRLAEATKVLASGGTTSKTAETSNGPLGQVVGSVAAAGDHLRDLEAKLARESAERQRLEQTQRELEDRYMLAVERANDGMWDCHLKTGAIEFSPRWQGMLGYLDNPPATLAQWKQLVHPMDLDGVMLRLDNHCEGLTPYFDAEYRVLHRDGHYRSMHSRGTAIRHASGKAYRLVVMDNDISARKEIEDTLIQAAEGLSSVSGMDFFRALMKSLSGILGTRDNLVCHVVGSPPTKARTLAYLTNDEFTDNFEYDLEGTSCGAVIARKEIVYVPHGVCELWPLEKQYDRDSYLGVPLFDSTGQIIGHFACMDGKPMRQDHLHLALFKIFAVRAAAELERTLLKERLALTKAG
jgi:PAS domain S-box-containing protein